MINTKYLNWVHQKKKGMKNVEQNENSPVETIDGRLKGLHTNEIDGRKRLRLREEKKVGGRENKGNLEGGTDEYLEEKTPVENTEDRKQRLRTSRMDTRLRTPVPRRKRLGGWEKQRQLRTGKNNGVGGRTED